MDLDHARKIVGSYAHLHGESSDGLVRRVMNAPGFVNPGKPLSSASSLEQGVVLRPIEALHQLAYATASHYQDDVLEIGIAFGGLLARRWFAWTGAGRAPVSIVDVDVALDGRYVFAGGARRPVRKIGKYRPDYLLIAADPQARGNYRIRTLECKGTKNPSTAIKQLGKAVQQLDGITVDGRILPGLATSIIASNDALSYLAIDPADGEEPAYEVNSATIDEARHFRLREDTGDLPSLALANAAVSASWAMLADFGGNFTALEHWVPDVMRTRLTRRPRDREHFDTPFGRAVGTSVTFSFAGRQVTARNAISEAVDLELGQDTAERVIESQARFAEQLPQPEYQVGLDDSNEFYSATTDGSIFSLSFR
ncbi:hypothetical protein [Amycolatopsis sp. H20-H5]|uniref:hypothetical protein n=1 Tax=Amycolatopsis sp. H20-H5 TaxID=3046309 RepID=UPI002DB60AA1|nr:hypothetical protein [Amycolatopsis sp. H20-H5]MEC3974090.1 hypothetical protein [Amycolatopsis sp. H20-H5]